MKPDLRLYGLLDRARLEGRDLAELARLSVEGGVTLLQLRDKHSETRQIIDTAREIIDAIGEKVPLLINDRVDVALASGAAGVHLGRSDMRAGDARRLLGPDAIIGVTLKNATDIAELDPELINYGCIGGVFATSSKNNPDRPIGLSGLANLRSMARNPSLPVGAIAGIDLTNAGACIGAGADGVAVISALYLAEDVIVKAQEFRRAIDAALAARGAA